MGFAKKFLGSILDFFFPRTCPFCDRILNTEHAIICADCQDKINFVQNPLCTCCGKPYEVKGLEDHFCGECLREKRFYTRVRAVLFYEDRVMEAIHRFKYGSAIYYAKPLGALMYERGRNFFNFNFYDLIVPVPLHKKRVKEREYNQSQLLAEEVSKHSGIPVECALLERIKETNSQVGLKKEEREKNVRNAFAVVVSESVKDKTILLIDDVISTTATVNECARALRKAGAKRVDVLALARGRSN
jgi:ComF family protein